MQYGEARSRVRRRSSGVRVNDRIALRGGLNIVDSASEIQAGELLVSKNYEPNYYQGAYTRIEGMERFDGQPRPHLAEYWKVELEDILVGYTVGETVTATGGATAIVALEVIDEVAADDTGYIIITDLSAEVDAGAVFTGGSSGATATSTADTAFDGEAVEDDHDTAQVAAEDTRRTDILTVGDSACTGSTLGVWVYNDVVYAFRNNAAETFATMWKSTAAGWVQIDLGSIISFDTGTIEFAEGDTVTGATSGASAVVKRVVVQSGHISGGDQQGYLVVNSITSGPFTNGENLQVSAATNAVADSTDADELQTIPIGGTYHFRNYNFGGHSSTYRMYGVNGVGYAFEFDGTTFAQIRTGMTTDTPVEISVHRYHLFLAFSGGSLQHSGYQQPLSWRPITGANELTVGDEVTGSVEEMSDQTFFFTRSQTYRLTGFVRENFQLKLHSYETGAIPNSVQRIGNSVYLDDRGFTNITATTTFGDFASRRGGFEKVDPLVQDFLKATKCNASVISRRKGLYRCLFASGENFVIGFSQNRVNGITTTDYGKVFTCACSNEIEAAVNDGEERVFYGATDGYVYEMDVGRNLDGEELEAYFVTAYHFSKSPEYNKRYRDCVLYMDGKSRATMKVSADYNYNEETQNFETILDEARSLGGGRYDISRWGDFVYSAQSKGDIRVSMDSNARNVSLIVYHKQDNEGPHTLYSVEYHYSMRRLIRR